MKVEKSEQPGGEKIEETKKTEIMMIKKNRLKTLTTLFAIAAIACLSHFAEAQTPKAEAVKKLVDLTFQSHPYVGIEAQLALLPGRKDAKEVEEIAVKQRVEVFDDALKVNSKLTPEQKDFAKSSYDRMSKIVDKIVDDTIAANFPTEKWIKDGLRQSYNAKFTDKELNALVAFFQETRGRQVLKYLRLSKMAQLITGNGGTLDYTDADKAEYDKFAVSAIGKRFMTAYIDEAEAYEQRQENVVRDKNSNADGFAIWEPANLNKFINRFVSENYKK